MENDRCAATRLPLVIKGDEIYRSTGRPIGEWCRHVRESRTCLAVTGTGLNIPWPASALPLSTHQSSRWLEPLLLCICYVKMRRLPAALFCLFWRPWVSSWALVIQSVAVSVGGLP